MKIKLKRIDDAFQMEASNESGKTVITDASPAIGGGDKGIRPMEMLLASLGSCSSIDIIHLLKKQRQDLKDIKINIEAEREKDKVPALFTNINIHFTLIGDIDEKKAERAVRLSMETLCSVSKIIEKTAPINWSYEVVN